jgi:hypothetical protein
MDQADECRLGGDIKLALGTEELHFSIVGIVIHIKY